MYADTYIYIYTHYSYAEKKRDRGAIKLKGQNKFEHLS